MCVCVCVCWVNILPGIFILSLGFSQSQRKPHKSTFHPAKKKDVDNAPPEIYRNSIKNSYAIVLRFIDRLDITVLTK